MDKISKIRLVNTFFALVILLLIGTFGYYFLTDGSNDIFLCFYMTAITVTTIGFEEVIDLDNNAGARLFTIFLAIGGIGLLTYFVSSISVIIIEGDLRQSFKLKKMKKEISNFENHYIICGVSRHSYHVIEELVNTDIDNIFIEISKDVIEKTLIEYPDLKYIEGDATNDSTLINAGILKAKGLFVSTSDDNVNLVICLSARQLNKNIKIVSICTNYFNTDKMKLAGADNVISPNYIGGLRMASEMLKPDVTDFLDNMQNYKNNKIRFEQIDLYDRYNNKKIKDLKIDELKNTIFIALKRNNKWLFKPDDDLQIESKDVLIIMTTPEEKIKLEQLTNLRND